MCRPGMRQVLRRWQHLLNTPSAPITDELDLQKGLNRLQTGQIRAKRLEYDPFKEFAILIVALATLIDARHAARDFAAAGTVTARGAAGEFRLAFRELRAGDLLSAMVMEFWASFAYVALVCRPGANPARIALPF
jgi:hypothetical protein